MKVREGCERDRKVEGLQCEGHFIVSVVLLFMFYSPYIAV